MSNNASKSILDRQPGGEVSNSVLVTILLIMAILGSGLIIYCNRGKPANGAVELVPTPPYPKVLHFELITYPGITQYEFNNWRSYKTIPLSDLKPIDAETIEYLQTKAVVFDCNPWMIDDALANALVSAPHLKWLCLGPYVQPDDLVWIGQLKDLRGLDLEGAKLKGGDFQLLNGLDELRYLNLQYVEFPYADEFELPAFPKWNCCNSPVVTSTRHLLSK